MQKVAFYLFRIPASILFFICGVIYTVAETLDNIATGPRVVPVPRTPHDGRHPRAESTTEPNASDVARLGKMFADNPDLFTAVTIEVAIIEGNARLNALTQENCMPEVIPPSVTELNQVLQQNFPVPDFLKPAPVPDQQMNTTQGNSNENITNTGRHS